jgi:hypothetical protein
MYIHITELAKFYFSSKNLPSCTQVGFDLTVHNSPAKTIPLDHTTIDKVVTYA